MWTYCTRSLVLKRGGVTGVLVVGAAWLLLAGALLAGDPQTPFGARSGGALQESYRYHRRLPYAPLSSVPRYAYGFPVATYKWGWFGAHYYPRTTWHSGYNGDHWQWSYRKGY
jgi:hypothetical protein